MSSIVKKTSNYFSKPYYTDFLNVTARLKRYEFVTADCEAALYYKEDRITDKQAQRLYEKYGQEWFKRNIESRAYSFQLYCEDGVAMFDNIGDFLTCCALMRVKVVAWYYAEYDFPMFDYWFAMNGWTEFRGDSTRCHRPPETYSSLQNMNGSARYCITVTKSVHSHGQNISHTFHMQDFYHVLQGGIKALFEDYDVRGADGEPIRKLEMDYEKGDFDSDIEYRVNDVKGLYYLILKWEDMGREMSGLSYMKRQYLTIGTFSQKMSFRKIYGSEDDRANKEQFNKDFPIEPWADTLFRNGNLYRGGLTIINDAYRNTPVHNVYKYDVNSLYPYMMANMRWPYGGMQRFDDIQEDRSLIQIVRLKHLYGTLKLGKIPTWRSNNPMTQDQYVDIIDEHDILIFLWELREYENWYDLAYDVDYVLCWKGKQNKGMRQFVTEMYEIKKTESGARRNMAKMVLNTLSGKYGQRKEKRDGRFEMTEGGYMKFKAGREYEDKKSLFNVVISSIITSLGRCYLLYNIREVCEEDVLHNFVYCDTDSIHTVRSGLVTDPVRLGAFKNEGIEGRPYESGIYLAQKTYLLVDESYWGTHDDRAFVIHTGGITPRDVRRLLKDCTSIEEMATKFAPGNEVYSTERIVVKGGSALVSRKKCFTRRTHYGEIQESVKVRREVFIQSCEMLMGIFNRRACSN